jgi:hypothetical protein
LPPSLPWCKNFAAFWAAPMFGPGDAGAGGVSAGFSPRKQDRFRSAGAQRARQGNGGQSAIHCIAAARQSFPSLVMLFWLSKGRRCRWRGRRRWLDHPLAGKRLSTGEVHSSEALVLELGSYDGPNAAAEEKNSPGSPSMGRGEHAPESGDTTTARFADAGVPAWRRLDGLALIPVTMP